MDVEQFQYQFQVVFNDQNLLKQAFTHSSYVNEHRQTPLYDNERLEFLGDAVLELGVSQFIYKSFGEMPEGEMTKLRSALVCEASLANFAKRLNFGKYIRLGKGEEQTGGRTRAALLADVFESFLGALYLDQGYEQVLLFLEKHIFPYINADVLSHRMDYKTKLQEIIQQYQNYSIEYQMLEVKGPSHDREFITEAKIDGLISKVGHGKTKKEAEQRAAKSILDVLQAVDGKLKILS